jgi:hypothetical protein
MYSLIGGKFGRAHQALRAGGLKRGNCILLLDSNAITTTIMLETDQLSPGHKPSFAWCHLMCSKSITWKQMMLVVDQLPAQD